MSLSKAAAEECFQGCWKCVFETSSWHQVLIFHLLTACFVSIPEVRIATSSLVHCKGFLC